MSGRPAALLFDLDGVLVHSEEVWFRLVEEAGRRYRGTPVTRKEFKPTFGQGTEADVKSFRFTCTPAQLDRFYVENFHRYTAGVLVDPQAKAVLESLAAAGIRRAVVTNTVSPLAKVLVERADLTSLVETIACVDHVPRAKPEPDLVLYALKALGVDAQSAWMIGDSKFDRAAATAAGVRFVGLRIDGDARIDALEALVPLVSASAA